MGQEHQLPIKDKQQIDQEFQFQAFLKDSEGKIKSTYNNAICVSIEQNDVYLLGFKQAFKGHLLKWSESIKYLIDNNYWRDALKLAQELFHERIFIFSSFPKMSEEKGRNNFNAITMDLIIVFLESNSKKIR